MKHFLTTSFLFLILAMAGIAKAQQWTELQTGLNEEYLWDICCIDEDHVLVCGNNGLIAKSTDGGLHWEQKDTPSTNTLCLLRFANDQVGFALGSSTLLKTIDGGETWNKMESVNDIPLDYYYSHSNLFLVDADTLYLSDSQNVVWKSSDGGESFFQVIDLEVYYTACWWKVEMFFEDNMGYLTGHGEPWCYSDDEPVLFKTTDFGQTWEPVVFGLQSLDCIHTIHFTDKYNARIFGCFDEDPWYSIVETSDGFESFSLMLPDELGCYYYDDHWDYTRTMMFTSENDGCLIYNVDCIKHKTNDHYHSCSAGFTSDNGNTWTTMSNGINPQRYLHSIDGIGSTYYIAADGGIVYKINLLEDALDEAETFVKVFPNPTTDKVFVKIDTTVEPETPNPICIELIGADGCVVMQKTVHGNDVTVDLSNLSSGVYVLNVKGNSIIHRQTIIKTK